MFLITGWSRLYLSLICRYIYLLPVQAAAWRLQAQPNLQLCYCLYSLFKLMLCFHILSTSLESLLGKLCIHIKCFSSSTSFASQKWTIFFLLILILIWHFLFSICWYVLEYLPCLVFLLDGVCWEDSLFNTRLIVTYVRSLGFVKAWSASRLTPEGGFYRAPSCSTPVRSLALIAHAKLALTATRTSNLVEPTFLPLPTWFSPDCRQGIRQNTQWQTGTLVGVVVEEQGGFLPHRVSRPVVWTCETVKNQRRKRNMLLFYEF